MHTSTSTHCLTKYESLSHLLGRLCLTHSASGVNGSIICRRALCWGCSCRVTVNSYIDNHGAESENVVFSVVIREPTLVRIFPEELAT
jgi:hypothetical protein